MSRGDKPELALCALGGARHGKTTLALALEGAYGPPSATRARERATGYVRYETALRRYHHTDLLVAWRDAAMACGSEAGVLVVDASAGADERTRRHAFMARHLDLPLVVLVNKCDLVADARALDDAEAALREMLCDVGLAGDDLPVVRGAARPALDGDPAWGRALGDLADALDRHLPLPQRRLEAPFLMAVRNVLPVQGGGALVEGRVERGTTRAGREVEVVGLGPTGRAVVAAVERRRAAITEAGAGEHASLLLRGVGAAEAGRGRVVAAPGTAFAYDRALADVTPFGPPITEDELLRVVVRTADGVAATLAPRGDATLVALEAPVCMEPGTRFLVYSTASGLRGAGAVREVLG